jgi:hypothetical protein
VINPTMDNRELRQTFRSDETLKASLRMA